MLFKWRLMCVRYIKVVHFYRQTIELYKETKLQHTGELNYSTLLSKCAQSTPENLYTIIFTHELMFRIEAKQMHFAHGFRFSFCKVFMFNTLIQTTLFVVYVILSFVILFCVLCFVCCETKINFCMKSNVQPLEESMTCSY